MHVYCRLENLLLIVWTHFFFYLRCETSILHLPWCFKGFLQDFRLFHAMGISCLRFAIVFLSVYFYEWMSYRYLRNFVIATQSLWQLLISYEWEEHGWHLVCSQRYLIILFTSIACLRCITLCDVCPHILMFLECLERHITKTPFG